MDPVTAAVVGTIGTAVSAVGQISSGMAAKNEAAYRAQVADNNRKIAEQNAAYAQQAGAAQAEAAGRRARAQQGTITAALAASGVDVNSGSAEDARRSTAETGLLNQLTTEHNAMLQAYGYRSQGTGFAAQAQLERSAADRAIPSALLGAGSSLLSGVSKLPLKYAWMGDPMGQGLGYGPGPGTGGLY